jgi:hypothetical protein
MSTLANITSLNLSLQTGGAALAIKAVKSVAKPARTVYVFGTADDVAPNFTTVSGALTYANSLTPIVTEPVVIRLFTKADGTPYDLTGLDPWLDYIDGGIVFESDFVRLNTTTILPTGIYSGFAGRQVWYIDPNGVETLWVGREDGSAQQVGSTVTSFVPTITVDGGTITTTDSLFLTKIGNLVSIGGTVRYTVTGSPLDPFSINGLPVGFRPLFESIALVVATPNASLGTFYPASVLNDAIAVSVDASVFFGTGDLKFSVMGTWAV